MATKSASTKKSAAAPARAAGTSTATNGDRAELNLATVIAELQFIDALSKDSKKDPRLKQLCDDAETDVVAALEAVRKGDDLPDVTDQTKKGL
jgi:hypothetical protein